jgi:hypothetical protein
MLLEAGASLERADPADLCRFAATSTATIQALIDRGVNVRELRISDDSTPLHVAAWNARATSSPAATAHAVGARHPLELGEHRRGVRRRQLGAVVERLVGGGSSAARKW